LKGPTSKGREGEGKKECKEERSGRQSSGRTGEERERSPPCVGIGPPNG